MDGRQFVETAETAPEESVWVGDICAQATGAGRRLHLVLGSPLPSFRGGKFRIGTDEYTFSGSVIRRAAQRPSADRMLGYAMRYMDAPYLWGGRTPFGIDCSGLVQMSLRVFGIRLPRDSVDQRQNGFPSVSLSEARPGDLAFFENSRDASHHVGFVYPGNQILHASGSVRLDRLDDAGIWHRGKDQLTHRLLTICRVPDFGG